MNENLKYYLFYTVAYGIVLLVGEISYRYLKTGPAISRNFAHLAAGLISLPYPWLFTSHWWVLLLAVQSTLVLLLTRITSLLPSHHKIASKSLGSYLFFASLYLCYLASNLMGQEEYFVVPILVLSFSDVAAAVAGRSKGSFPWAKRTWPGKEGKTIAGSITFFLSTQAILLPFLLVQGLNPFVSMGLAAAFSLPITMSEALSPMGSDNLFVPITVLIFMYLIF